jgi:hypothetical protein
MHQKFKIDPNIQWRFHKLALIFQALKEDVLQIISGFFTCILQIFLWVEKCQTLS